MLTTSDSAREIRISRVYDAPLALVWDAFTDDAQVTQWWGPRGFTITTHSKDLRPGGTWVYTMHGPDGTDWPNFTRYLEVEPQARLVYDHGASSADTDPLFRMTAIFRDVNGRTELELCMTLATLEAAQQARTFVKAAGGNATWDRLAEYLEKQASNEEIFVMNRSFDAPIDTMFDMFTSPEQLTKWLPPVGFTMESHRGEYSHGFTGEHEQTARHPNVPAWPERLHTVVQLTEEGPAQTRVTIRSSVSDSATGEEVTAFVSTRLGMAQGWTGSFDTLEALVALTR